MPEHQDKHVTFSWTQETVQPPTPIKQDLLLLSSDRKDSSEILHTAYCPESTSLEDTSPLMLKL